MAESLPDIAAFKWTAAREVAAGLVADGDKTEPEIAKQVGVSERTLRYWKQHAAFSARVDELVAEARAAAKAKTIANKEFRVAQLADRQERMRRLIEARATEHDGIPGGDTGLLVAEPKMVKVFDANRRGKRGKRDDDYADQEDDDQLTPTGRVQVMFMYKADTALLAEMRNTEKQAAIELGEWTEKSDTTLNASESFVAAMMEWGNGGRDS